MKRIIYLSAILLILFSSQSYSQNKQKNAKILSKFDKYAEQVCKDWKIPGVSIAVTKDNEMIFSKSYGVRDISNPIPVTNESVYQIGSISKSFTAGVLASLVDDGLVNWNDTVKNILPDLDMYDDWVEENLTVKELLLHRTGLKGQAGTYIPNLGYDRDDIYQMFKDIKPNTSFREVYAYNNITFIIAAKIIEKITGKTWEENVQTRIFNPLGMTQSSMNETGWLAAGEKATIPHEFYYVKDSMHVAPLYDQEQALHWLTVIGPAGSITSTASDLLKWSQFHLNMGKVGETEVISEKNMKFLHKGQTIVSQSDDYMRLYGLCWFVEQNDKYKLFFHTGTTWGQVAICAFVPELDLGITVLCNSEVPSSPRYAMMRRLIDLYLGDTSKDWNKDYLESWWKNNRQSLEKRENKEKVEHIEAPAANSLLGKYFKEAPFGGAEVTLENGDLYLTIGKYNWKNKLSHSNGNTYTFRSQGHTFPITFVYEKNLKEASGFDIDFDGDENFGLWKRINK